MVATHAYVGDSDRGCLRSSDYDVLAFIKVDHVDRL